MQYAVMRPLVCNVPVGRPEWQIVPCEQCAALCWKRTDIEPAELPPNMFFCCTRCALKASAAAAR